jgi:starch phosphorylase
MEYAIDQSLKIYSGGLGFLAGSHLRSAYALNKNLVAVGMLWKYGYYDQERDENGHMVCNFKAKSYHFLEDTQLKFTVNVHDKEVWVKVWKLNASTFNTAPLYLLSTDLPENDYLSQTITHHLYDKNDATRVAQSIILGVGGAKLLDILGLKIDTYHLNEAHALPLAFYLYQKFNDLALLKKHLVFTTHTPEAAGNEERDYALLYEMHFFAGLSLQLVQTITGQYGAQFNYTLAALRLSKIANAVSKIHGEVSNSMWKKDDHIAQIITITNAQNQAYWQDGELKLALEESDYKRLVARKKQLKAELFRLVADQTGKLFDPNVLTIVWARRFAGYKRADLLLKDFEQFTSLVTRSEYPIQVIWAGKPYPFAQTDIDLFNYIQSNTEKFDRVAVLTGYELAMSAMLKKGADVWLNTPRYGREASGTSGMSAAMNGAVNCSIPDGWVAEFAHDKHNAFVIPVATDLLHDHVLLDQEEGRRLYQVLTESIIPIYYTNSDEWSKIMMHAMKEVVPYFDSDRMVNEYDEKMYE